MLRALKYLEYLQVSSELLIECSQMTLHFHYVESVEVTSSKTYCNFSTIPPVVYFTREVFPKWSNYFRQSLKTAIFM